MGTVRLAWGLSLTLLLAPLACRQIDHPRTLTPGAPGVEETRSGVLQRVQFSDIPVPPGFGYVTRGNRSFSFSQGGVRVGRFRYWGHQDIDGVASFYRLTMVLRAYAWEFASESRDGGVRTLHFRKRRQTCEVTIKEEAGDTYVDLFVTGPAT